MVAWPIALAVALGLLILSMVLAASLNRTTLGILIAGTLLSITYSRWLKRTPAGFLPPALGAALLPLGAWSIYSPESVLSGCPLLLAGIGFSFELVPYWCQSVLDVESDRVRKLKTVPALLGTLRTAQIMLVVVALSLIMVGSLFWVSALSRIYLGVAAGFGLAILLGHLDFVIRHDPRRAARLFVADLAYITLVSIAIMTDVSIRYLAAIFRNTMAL
jgi:4-hydroxybenzoate polyprenyltransferase